MANHPGPQDRARIQAELTQLNRSMRRASTRRLKQLAVGGAAALLVGLNAGPALAAINADANCNTREACIAAIRSIIALNVFLAAGR